jgi:LemA protein
MEMILGVGLVFCAVVFILIYNSLIGRKNEVDNAMGGIDTYLKKRYDLIPNLVEATKQYMQHEKSLLEEITRLRTEVLKGDKDDDEVVELNNQITHKLDGIKVAVENYPDLKSNTNFLELQKALGDVEENIAAARRYFNSAVTDFNNGIEMFPHSIIAGMMGLRRKHVFEAAEHEKKNVNLKELF